MNKDIEYEYNHNTSFNMPRRLYIDFDKFDEFIIIINGDEYNIDKDIVLNFIAPFLKKKEVLPNDSI